ncbi:MAG: Pyranose 2-oxidase [Tremellales sp. Tagirdzhanova-0007]|nr:MAG: Pyranose 2-oxidase [Tremellales sp. Tagirdzhanova-0007]
MIPPDLEVVDTDVLIIGSGPAGCTYAKSLLEGSDFKVLMVEMGTQQSSILGENLKNAAYFQRNMDAFSHVIMGHLHQLDPGSKDLPGASATYAVGGMATHWTCATPRPHRDEMPTDLPYSGDDEECDRLYTIAEDMIGTHRNPFDDLIGQKIAKYFVVACGALLGPQLLHASGLGGDNNGRYLTDHPVAFTQVVLSDKHFAWARANLDGTLSSEEDPIPIPKHESDPQLYTPYTTEYPWHTQIHREAFQYGTLGNNVDPRTVIHLRWYGKQDPQRDNRIIFDDKQLDIWGLPSLSFACKLSKNDNERCERIYADMIKFAQALGPYLPGSEPHWRPYGQALHACGTTRIGSDPTTSVLDPYSRLHDHQNVY